MVSIRAQLAAAESLLSEMAPQRDEASQALETLKSRLCFGRDLPDHLSMRVFRELNVRSRDMVAVACKSFGAVVRQGNQHNLFQKRKKGKRRYVAQAIQRGSSGGVLGTRPDHGTEINPVDGGFKPQCGRGNHKPGCRCHLKHSKKWVLFANQASPRDDENVEKAGTEKGASASPNLIETMLETTVQGEEGAPEKSPTAPATNQRAPPDEGIESVEPTGSKPTEAIGVSASESEVEEGDASLARSQRSASGVLT